MAGRKPIIISLISGVFTGLRDLLFKVMLEPPAHKEEEKKEK